jgi:hypothetical protein
MPTSRPQFRIATNTEGTPIPVPVLGVVAFLGVGAVVVLGLFLNALFQRWRRLPPDLPPPAKKYALKLKPKPTPAAAPASVPEALAVEDEDLSVNEIKIKPDPNKDAFKSVSLRIQPLEAEAELDVDTSLEVDDSMASDEEWS